MGPARRHAVVPAGLVQTVACGPAAPKLVAVTAVAAVSCAAAGSPRLRAGPVATCPTSGPAGPPASPETADRLAAEPVLAARLKAAVSTPAARRGMRLARRYPRIPIRHHNPATLLRCVVRVAFSGFSWVSPINGADAEIPHARLMGAPESLRVISKKSERGGFCHWRGYGTGASRAGMRTSPPRADSTRYAIGCSPFRVPGP